MITVRDFNEAVNHRITEGSEYLWQCYGPNAYRLDSWNGDQDGHTVSIVFDTVTQTVYEASAYDYQNNRAYRLINPDFKQAYYDEATDKSVNADQAWDDVNYIDLEVDDDFLEKAQAIAEGLDYDTRVKVPVELPDDVMLELMKQAHEKDITFNQLMEEVLQLACKHALEKPVEFSRQAKALKEHRKLTDALDGNFMIKKKKVKRKHLAAELLGVISDIEDSNEFDEQCLDTIKRVYQELAK